MGPPSSYKFEEFYSELRLLRAALLRIAFLAKYTKPIDLHFRAEIGFRCETHWEPDFLLRNVCLLMNYYVKNLLIMLPLIAEMFLLSFQFTLPVTKLVFLLCCSKRARQEPEIIIKIWVYLTAILIRIFWILWKYAKFF